ncbi:MAG: hypothetical protein J0I11_12740 [Actinobacteria bacterium]|nr:hypothetical protein [Actinomycetota bacterium]
MTTAVPTDSLPSDRALPRGSVRRWAFLALVGFPMWVVCFVLLYGALGAEPAEMTPAESIAYYRAGGAAIWAFTVIATVASVVMALALVGLSRSVAGPARHNLLARLALVAATVGGIAGMASGLGTFVTLVADPDRPSALAEALVAKSPASAIVNGVAWTLLLVAVTLLAFALRRAGVLRRGGLIIGVLGALLTVVMLATFFFVPVVAAALELAVGAALLARRQ